MADRPETVVASTPDLDATQPVPAVRPPGSGAQADPPRDSAAPPPSGDPTASVPMVMAPGPPPDATVPIPMGPEPAPTPPPSAFDPFATQVVPDVGPGPGTDDVLPGFPNPPTPVGEANGTAMAAAMATTADPVEAGAGPRVIDGARKRRSPVKLVAAVLVGLLVLFYGAWAADLALSDGKVRRNTLLAATPIAGLDEAGLAEVVSALNAELATRSLLVDVDGISVPTTPAALGAGLDADSITTEALAVRRSTNPLTGPIEWISTFLSEEIVEVSYLVDEEEARLGAADVFAAHLPQMVEPGLSIAEGEFVVSPGSVGITVDPAEITELLPPALDEQDEGEVSIALTPVEIAPDFTDAQLQAVADEAAGATSGVTEIQILDDSAELDTATIRSWISFDTSGEEPTWIVDSAAALEALKPAFPSLGTEDQKARFDLVDGRPVVVPASETVICCEAASLDSIKSQLLAAGPVAPPEGEEEDEAEPVRTLALEPEIVSGDEGVTELESLGIVEEVSTFTTQHPAGQPRVTNIHRFADIVRGAVIRPGEEFSLNGHVGERTIEKGFVADHAIANGVMTDQVGGGVSQFATTFFNASFFAGLELLEFQSHSLYISRYPRGREATISWTKPDLRVRNDTPYGILIWPTYTDTSLTVTFYSTKYVEVTAGATYDSPQGAACTRVTTPRTRTYPDGSVVEDSVFAVYRPAEGINCDGTSSNPDPEGPTIVDESAVPVDTPAPVEPPAPAPETAPTGAGAPTG